MDSPWKAVPRGRARGRWLLAGLIVAMIAPNIGARLWGTAPSNPGFFKDGAYRAYVKPGETLLALPFGANGDSMLWQAETGFYFRMPEGYLGHYAPEAFGRQPIVNELGGNAPADPAALVRFLRHYHVSHIVIDGTEAAASPYPHELARLGLHGVSADGVLLYEVSPAWAKSEEVSGRTDALAHGA